MDIDKRFFEDVEEALRLYGLNKENYVATFGVTESRPAEAFIILALRCRTFIEGKTLNVSVNYTDRDRILIDNEVRIDFFPRGNHIYFSNQNEPNINEAMKKYLITLKRKYTSKELDYHIKCINIGICKHCNKDAIAKHPDYEYKHICNDCLKQKNRFLVVVQ